MIAKSDHKTRFIDEELLAFTFFASITRGEPVYGTRITQEKKDKFKEFVKRTLLKYAKKYKSKLSEKEHISNIENIKREIESKFKDKNTLNKNNFYFGRAQKLLNLYLKYLWCLGRITKPPHCPFDRIVISELGLDFNWTSLTKEDYEKLIVEARKKAGSLSLAEWELEFWNMVST